MPTVLALPEISNIYQPGELGTTPARPDEVVDPEIWAFLDHHFFLMPVLRDADGPLRDAFGERTHVSISIETDPEVEGWEYLVMAIRTTLPALQAQAQLDAFGDAWWLENLPRAQGLLLYTLEFV